MSSKVLRGAASAPITWRKVLPEGGESPGDVYPRAGSEAASAPQARIAALERESALREQQAMEDGMRRGEEQARAEFTAQMREILERAARSLEELMEARRQMRRRMEEDLVKLAVAVARRILHRELSVDPEALTGIVKAALEGIDTREVRRVRTHPSDAEILRGALNDFPLASRLEVAGDPNLERGDVVLETSRGSLDASVTTQLQEIERGFADLLRRSHASR
jgi:flagellar assembly protein FliH